MHSQAPRAPVYQPPWSAGRRGDTRPIRRDLRRCVGSVAWRTAHRRRCPRATMERRRDRGHPPLRI